MQSKKNWLFLFLVMCIGYSIKAQSPDPVKVRVFYKFRFMNDTTARNDFANENMVLLIGEKTSVYQSYNSYKTDSIIKNRSANLSGGVISVGNIPIRSGSGATEKQFTILAKNQLLSTNRVYTTQYLVDESAKQTQWNITSDTKEIGGITCQKATARVKGRDYAAWFAPELPYSLGPWKLNNLPGLILEASDSKGEVFFELERIATDATTAAIEFPTRMTPVSLAEFVKIKATFDADPQGFMRANAPPPPPGMSGGMIAVSGSMISDATVAKPPTINNKIEKEN